MNEDTGDFYIMKGKKLKRGLALVLGLMLAAEFRHLWLRLLKCLIPMHIQGGHG